MLDSVARHPVLAILGVLLLGWFILSEENSAPAPQSAPEAAAAQNGHQQIVDAAAYGCEKFVRANSRQSVGEVIDTWEVPSTGAHKLKMPNAEAWVGLDYRVGANGQLMWAQCHYAKFGKDVVLMDHEGGLR
jgi:hypothetical protein